MAVSMISFLVCLMTTPMIAQGARRRFEISLVKLGFNCTKRTHRPYADVGRNSDERELPNPVTRLRRPFRRRERSDQVRALEARVSTDDSQKSGAGAAEDLLWPGLHLSTSPRNVGVSALSVPQAARIQIRMDGPSKDRRASTRRGLLRSGRHRSGGPAMAQRAVCSGLDRSCHLRQASRSR